MYRQKLYIRTLSPMDTGIYTCDAFHHGQTYDQQVSVDILGRVTIGDGIVLYYFHSLSIKCSSTISE